MRFELAASEHEPALRRLMRDSVMPGAFRLAYAREPDLGLSLGVEGLFHQALVALEREQVVGMAVRAIRRGWVNGEAAALGYLGGLRSLEGARGGLGLAKGYRFLRTLHQDGRTAGYLTTILESNVAARTLLTSRRAGLPGYFDLGRYSTYAVLIRGTRRCHEAFGDVEVVHPPEVDLTAVLSFLDQEGQRRQFGPVYGERLEPASYYHGFRPQDFYVARRKGAIIGVVGVWDQRSYKQTLVEGYGGWARWLRPLINPILGGLGYPQLPGAGAALDQFSIAFIGIRDDDPRILRTLLEAVHRDHQHAGFHSFLIGLHERDPLRQALRPFLTVPYHARLGWVCWDDGLECYRGLDPQRVPYLELARL